MWRAEGLAARLGRAVWPGRRVLALLFLLLHTHTAQGSSHCDDLFRRCEADAGCQNAVEWFQDNMQDNNGCQGNDLCIRDYTEQNMDTVCDQNELFVEAMDCVIEVCEKVNPSCDRSTRDCSTKTCGLTACSSASVSGSNVALVVVIIIIVVVLAVATLIACIWLQRSKGEAAAVGEIAPLQQATAAVSPHTVAPTMHVAHGVVPSALPGQPLVKAAISTNPPAGLDAMRTQLMGLSVGELRQRAAADGCEESQIEDARDAKDPRSELIDLIMEQASKAPPQVDLGALRVELSLLSVKNLRERATTAGVDVDALEEARDAHDPVQAIIELILASTTTASPAPDPAVLRTQLEGRLSSFTTKKLREFASAEGIDAGAIDEARDSREPPAALSALILALPDTAGVISRLPATTMP